MATCHPSITAWDHFTFPQTEEKHWTEEVLSHYPGKVVDVRARIPEIKLMMQNEERCYGNITCTLKYEGHMLIYNPQKDISQWVPVRDVSTSLMSLELRLANDLNNMNPYLHDGQGLMELHSPRMVQDIPTGQEEESDMESYVEPSDSGEEWGKAECSDWSCCPALPLGEEGPTWVEATAEALQRKIITWDEVTSDPPQKKVASDREDSDWDDDTHAPAESQFEDATVPETCMDTKEETTADSPREENVIEALVGPGSQDVVQIHVGSNDLNPLVTGLLPKCYQ